MNKRVYTALELYRMPYIEYRAFIWNIKQGNFWIFGMAFKTSMTWREDCYGNLHFEWE